MNEDVSFVTYSFLGLSFIYLIKDINFKETLSFVYKFALLQ